jgi:hypothetical protein
MSANYDIKFNAQFEGLQKLGGTTYLDSNLNTVSAFKLAWRRFVCWLHGETFKELPEAEKYRALQVAAAIKKFIIDYSVDLFGECGNSIEKNQLKKLVKVVANLDKLHQTLGKTATGSQKEIEDVAYAARKIRIAVNLRNPGTFKAFNFS